jgi:hypothetical protein
VVTCCCCCSCVHHGLLLILLHTMTCRVQHDRRAAHTSCASLAAGTGTGSSGNRSQSGGLQPDMCCSSLTGPRHQHITPDLV